MTENPETVPKGHSEASFRYKSLRRKIAGRGKFVPKGHLEASFRYRKQARMVAGKGKSVPSRLL